MELHGFYENKHWISKEEKKIVHLLKEITSGLRFQFLVVRDNRRNYPGFL